MIDLAERLSIGLFALIGRIGYAIVLFCVFICVLAVLTTALGWLIGLILTIWFILYLRK